MSEMKRKIPQISLPGWITLPVMTLIAEVMVHVWVTDALSVGRLAAVALFALGLGCVLGCLVSLIPNLKVQKWVTALANVVVVVICLVQYFLNDAYQTFMPFDSVFSGAQGVATDFGDTLLALLANDFWRILVMLLPAAAYLCFVNPRQTGWKVKGLTAVAAVCLYLLGFGLVHLVKTDAARLSTAYNFNGAVHAFGVNMAVALDTFRSNEDGLTFETDTVQEVTPTTQATEATEEVPEETVTEPVVYESNALPLDFAAMAEEEPNNLIANMHSYVDSLTPSMQNEYTGLFEGKNLIFITAEAFAAEVIDPELTPTLYRMANEGIKFTDFYQPMWGGSTITGEYANLVGLVAYCGVQCIMDGTTNDQFLTIGNQLRDLGYFSAAYHNHTYTYYQRNVSHTYLGYDTFTGMGNGMEQGVTEQWPASDVEMMQHTLPQYIDQAPFSIYYMTVSGHCPYNTLGGNHMSSKNYEKVEHLDCSHSLKCYLAAQLEVEYSLQYLVEELEKAGILEDTVFVVSADHYPYGLEKSVTWNNNQDLVGELYGYSYKSKLERDHNALIIWSPCLEDMDLQVDEPSYSLDILPTLSNLFGVEYDSRLLVGRDVLSDTEALVLWYDHSWITTKGRYDADTNVFTPNEGVEIEEGYVDRIASIVTNKINYSRYVQEYDYFNYLTPFLEE